ncbi:siphovirus Gp157 family protein [Streptococcus suis]|nr:siphovirus Gp157 family protein [Streptococcus suis]
MSYLYELEGIYAQLQAMELDDETFNDTLDSIDFQEDLERNIEYFVKMWKNALSDAERFKQAKQEFYEKEKNAKAKAEKYKETIERALKISNKQKVDAGLFTVSLRKSKQVDILDETKIPLEFMKMEYKPIKTEIAKHLKAGEVIEGVTMIEKESLQVR